MSVPSLTVNEPLLRTACTLGEGPLWDAYTSTLHFVDILKRQVLHYNTITARLTVDQFDEPITCLAIRRGGAGLACATAQGIATINAGALSYLAKPLPVNEAPYTRFNDGACDRRGRFVVGTVQSPDGRVPGKLYSFDPRTRNCTVLDTGFTDGNGLGWSADDKTLFFTNSLVNHIYAYDYDINTGGVSNRRTFIDACALGYPSNTYCDGLCIDSEGCIWSARWGNSRITRHKRNGAVDFEIVFPKVYTVTSCCFGGPNMDQLYVTTAHCGANNGPAHKQAQFPYSGDLFKVDLAGRFKGLPRFEFGA